MGAERAIGEDMTRLSIPAFFLASLVFFASGNGLLAVVSDLLTELRFAAATRPATGAVAVVELDTDSLQAVGTWPWPRRVHARLLDELNRLGAAEIAFDIDFSARSTPQDDAALERALERAGGSVILAAFSQPASAADPRIHTNRPLDRFSRHAWAASVNVFADADGKVRRFPLGQVVDGEVLPSMPAMLGGHLGLADTAFPIDFSIRAGDVDRISAVDVLERRVDPARIAGRKLIVGAGAAELRDTFAVPVYGIMSGPLVQALATETVLQGRVLATTGGAADGLGLALVAVLVVLALNRLRGSSTLFMLGGLAVAAEAGAYYLLAERAVILDTAAWQVGIGAFMLLVVAREIDLRQILVFISSREAKNVRTVLDQVVSDNFDGVIVVEEDGRIAAASRIAAATLRSDPEAGLDGEVAGAFLPEAISASVEKALADARAGRMAARLPEETSHLVPGTDTARILEFVTTPSRLEGGSDLSGELLPDRLVVCVTFRDVTERRHAEARLVFLARNDPLTGLANKNEFCERLAAALERQDGRRPSGAVICLDLDRFRNVNDTLGHAIGDRLLREVARRVGGLVGNNATLARFGGDEFGILLDRKVGRSGADRLAGRIVQAIAEPMKLDGHRVIVAASAGVAMLRGGGPDAEQVIRHADTALYRAKRDGGASHRFFDPQMDHAILERRALELELWHALERGEFEVVYQPQFDLSSRELNGVEALVRWRHRERGYVSPALFVPVAEDIGLIERIGEFVLREACREVASWPRPVKVAVNLSSVQFTRGNLVATVASALAETGLPAERFELEITESLLMGESGVTEAILAELRAMNIRFALDDFGTGYSSLSYIRRFPIHKIKIDRAFVVGLPADRTSLAIIRAITALADSLDLTTTVEGVETEDQAKLLLLAGCSQGQGYLFGKPQTGAEIVRLLGAGHAPSAAVA